MILPSQVIYDSRWVRQIRAITTQSPLTGGGDLSADRTISIPQSNTSQSGYLSSTDWTTFNAKGFRVGRIVGPSGSRADQVCDGAADHLDFLAQYNILGAAGGGELLLLPGDYYVNATALYQYSNVTIRGSGKGITTIHCQYSGTSGYENSYGGMFTFRNSDNVTPVNNIVMRDLSIDLAGFATNAIHIQGTLTAVTTSKNYLLDNVEIYGRGIDLTGSIGCIKISGTYNNVNGTVKNVMLNRVEVRDGTPTTSTYKNGVSVMVLSDDLSVVKFRDCYFHGTYSSTLGLVSRVPKARKDWVFEGVTFENTIRNYHGDALGDIDDGNACGFNGIRLVNCHWDCAPWTISDDIYAMKIYSSINFIVDHSTIFNPRSVIAAGLSPGSKESQNWTFSNNAVYNMLGFQDPDGHYAGTYANNVFWKSKYSMFGGYGRHYPSVYQGICSTTVASTRKRTRHTTNQFSTPQTVAMSTRVTSFIGISLPLTCCTDSGRTPKVAGQPTPMSTKTTRS